MVVMKILCKICLFIFLLSINNNNTTTPICNGNKSKIIKIGKQCVNVYNLPNGYCEKDIRIIIGNNYSFYIPFEDSSLIYFCMDDRETFNYDNINNMHTAVSCWRLDHQLYSPLKELSIDFQSIYLEECGCLLSDILKLDTCKTIDLRGVVGTKYWRDIMVGEYCLGYIVFDSTKIKSFDSFLDNSADNLTFQACED